MTFIPAVIKGSSHDSAPTCTHTGPSWLELLTPALKCSVFLDNLLTYLIFFIPCGNIRLQLSASIWSCPVQHVVPCPKLGPEDVFHQVSFWPLVFFFSGGVNLRDALAMVHSYAPFLHVQTIGAAVTVWGLVIFPIWPTDVTYLSKASITEYINLFHVTLNPLPAFSANQQNWFIIKVGSWLYLTSRCFERFQIFY